MNRNKIPQSLVFILFLGICSPNCTREGLQTADLVLRNGKILTLEEDAPEVTAIALYGDKIMALGSDEEIGLYIGESTEVIDLEGKLAVPGFIEGHGHFMRLGETLTQINLMHVSSWEEVIELVKEAVGKAEPGEWILGFGWHQDKWLTPADPNVEGLPVHHKLSSISAENPVLLMHASGHGVFANAVAMDLAGIDSNTPDPSGGEIVRDETGNPIGMMREAAQNLIREQSAIYLAWRTPEQIEADRRRHVELASRNAIENGITSFQDMGSTFATLDLLRTLADERKLTLRLYMAVQEESEVMKDKLAEYRMVDYGGYLTVRCIGEKVLDGALGTHGGWLLEPYTDLPRSVGFNVTPVEEIKASAVLAMQHDYQMAIQGIGDRAARILFDIYEESFKSNPEKSDLRWRIEHAQVIHPDDLPRFAELGVIPGIQGIFACSDGPWVVERLGEERTRERGYLYRSMIESGAVVMNGTDPPVEDIDPIASFYCSVTRILSDGSVFGPEQRMTREQALRAYTYNNAYAAFEEDKKGSLKPGKLADITVLSKDIMTIPEEEIMDAEVVYTIVGGKVVYRRE